MVFFGNRVIELLEMPKYGSSVDTQLSGGLAAIPAISSQDLIDVPNLKAFFCFREGQNGLDITRVQIEIFGGEEIRFGQNDGFSNSIFELPNISGPTVLSNRGQTRF